MVIGIVKAAADQGVRVEAVPSREAGQRVKGEKRMTTNLWKKKVTVAARAEGVAGQRVVEGVRAALVVKICLFRVLLKVLTARML